MPLLVPTVEKLYKNLINRFKAIFESTPSVLDDFERAGKYAVLTNHREAEYRLVELSQCKWVQLNQIKERDINYKMICYGQMFLDYNVVTMGSYLRHLFEPGEVEPLLQKNDEIIVAYLKLKCDQLRVEIKAWEGALDRAIVNANKREGWFSRLGFYVRNTLRLLCFATPVGLLAQHGTLMGGSIGSVGVHLPLRMMGWWIGTLCGVILFYEMPLSVALFSTIESAGMFLAMMLLEQRRVIARIDEEHAQIIARSWFSTFFWVSLGALGIELWLVPSAGFRVPFALCGLLTGEYFLYWARRSKWLLRPTGDETSLDVLETQYALTYLGNTIGRLAASGAVVLLGSTYGILGRALGFGSGAVRGMEVADLIPVLHQQLGLNNLRVISSASAAEDRELPLSVEGTQSVFPFALERYACVYRVELGSLSCEREGNWRLLRPGESH